MKIPRFVGTSLNGVLGGAAAYIIFKIFLIAAIAAVLLFITTEFLRRDKKKRNKKIGFGFLNGSISFVINIFPVSLIGISFSSPAWILIIAVFLMVWLITSFTEES